MIETLPMGVRLAVSPLSWANDVLEDLGADITVETCLADASGTGYQGIELGRKFPRDAEVLRPLLGNYGLSLASGWHSGELAERSVDEEMAAVASHARLLRAMGCQVMVYGEVAMMSPGSPLDQPMSQRMIMPKEDVPGYAARLTEFSIRLLGEYGLKLAYHHHLMMVAETYGEISRLFDLAGNETGLLLDTGHCAGGGFDYRRLIDRFGDRIVHIHLKDVRGAVMDEVRQRDLSFNTGVRRGMFTVPGDGNIDFSPLARFVRDSGYQGWLVVEAEQDPAVAPARAAVTRAVQHVSKVFEAS
ncbi:rhizopine catabolism protein MocC [Rhizobium freirei PRF 81]|uniref:Rhizopine catabolism protein MocC n=1 Tax=Rhizobium freirei PRF 81 TaxID=363754 RepID=N6TWX3_9HYPH|nr:myo-inosose-2 dehydratase [Rhizobium freirei]ENN84924.1 rhizopine catabolism protein MocC [Rhizobium freirei PRF 81]